MARRPRNNPPADAGAEQQADQASGSADPAATEGTEIVTTGPGVQAAHVSAMAALPPGWEVADTVVIPYLQLSENIPVFFQVGSEMTLYDEFAKTDDDGNRIDAPVIDIVELRTGEPMRLVVPIVLKSAFEEKMEGDYVGKAFMVTKIAEKASASGRGRKYYTYKVNLLARSASPAAA